MSQNVNDEVSGTHVETPAPPTHSVRDRAELSEGVRRLSLLMAGVATALSAVVLPSLVDEVFLDRGQDPPLLVLAHATALVLLPFAATLLAIRGGYWTVAWVVDGFRQQARERAFVRRTLREIGLLARFTASISLLLYGAHFINSSSLATATHIQLGAESMGEELWVSFWLWLAFAGTGVIASAFTAGLVALTMRAASRTPVQAWSVSVTVFFVGLAAYGFLMARGTFYRIPLHERWAAPEVLAVAAIPAPIIALIVVLSRRGASMIFRALMVLNGIVWMSVPSYFY